MVTSLPEVTIVTPQESSSPEHSSPAPMLDQPSSEAPSYVTSSSAGPAKGKQQFSGQELQLKDKDIPDTAAVTFARGHLTKALNPSLLMGETSPGSACLLSEFKLQLDA